MILTEEERKMLNKAVEVKYKECEMPKEVKFKETEEIIFPEIVVLEKEDVENKELNIVIPNEENSLSESIKEQNCERKRGLVLGCSSKEIGVCAINEEFGVQYLIREEEIRVEEEKKYWKLKSKVVRKRETVSRIFGLLGILALGLPYISLGFSIVSIISGIMRKRKDKELIQESRGKYKGSEKMYLGTIMGAVSIGLDILMLIL